VTSDEPLVSVLLPVRNGEAYLAEAVESVLAQTLAELELIAVDDRSEDGTPRLLRRFAERDPRVRIVTGPAQGVAAACESGLATARGALVARMDGDDVALPTRLEEQVEFLRSHPLVAAVGSAVRLVDGRGDVFREVHYPTDDATMRRVLKHAAPIAHPAATIRRSALAAVGGYRSVLPGAEDYDLWLRLSECYELANLDAVLLHYRVHAGQASFTSIGGQVVGAVAARASAAARHRGMPDPLDRRDAVRLEDLWDLGVGKGEVQDTLVTYASWWSRTMVAPGSPASARHCWRHARQFAREEIRDREMVQALHREEARMLRRRGRRLRAAWSFARGTWLLPA
jgi:glycosyltransferase involved in cell wall biosynthesis